MPSDSKWEAMKPTGHAAKFVSIRDRRTKQLVCIVEGPDAEANAWLIVNAPEMKKEIDARNEGAKP